MEKRTFKKTGEEISLLGFGCMRLPRVDPEKQGIDYEKAAEMIDCAYKSGVNYFDTAYVYHEQLSEPFLGEVMQQYPRETFNLATKMPSWLLNSIDDAKRIFEEQLKRCRVDHFDFYLAHGLNRDRIKISENLKLYDYLKFEQRQGRIRNLGFSFHDEPHLLEQVLDMHEWDFAQIQLNYMDWDLQDARGQYDLLAKRDMPIVVMEPVRGGTLATLSEDARNTLSNAEPGSTPASWGMRFAGQLPNVLTVLSGMSTLEQVEDNVKTFSPLAPLSPEKMSILQDALVAYNKSGAVPCTGCRYCMDCPFGVDIPKVFAVYNQYCVTQNKIAFGINYRVLGEAHNAHRCVACRKCVPFCPQFIDIPEQIRKVVEAIDNNS